MHVSPLVSNANDDGEGGVRELGQAWGLRRVVFEFGETPSCFAYLDMGWMCAPRPSTICTICSFCEWRDRELKPLYIHARTCTKYMLR